MSAWVKVDSDDWVEVDIDDAVDLTGVVDDFRVRVVVDCVVLVLLGIHTSRGEATRAYRHNTRTIRIVQSSVLTTHVARPSSSAFRVSRLAHRCHSAVVDRCLLYTSD